MATVANLKSSSADPAYSKRAIALASFCFVCSGATGLIYEVLWARMLGLVFGATTLAVSTVLAAFMGGLAFGSAIAGRVSASLRRPLRAYGLIEIGIAIYAVLVPVLFSWVDDVYAQIWQHFHPAFFTFSVWRFVLSSLILLVPTTLMGATLPVLVAALLRAPDYDSNSVTRLYTLNLAGAILGTLAAGFVLLPAMGLRRTIYLAALINLVIGLLAVFIDRSAISDPIAQRTTVDFHDSTTVADSIGFWLFVAFVSGFVTISAQVAWTRLLSMIIGSSTYAFSIVVALFLIGLSLGAFVIGRRDRTHSLRSSILKIELTTAAGMVLSLAAVGIVPLTLVRVGLFLRLNSWGELLLLQICSAALLILLPAFLMGTVMPLVLVWAGKQNKAVGMVGRSYAINTIGAIAGAFLSGFVLIPKTTTRFTILFAASLCLIVAGFAYCPRPGAKEPEIRKGFAIAGGFVLALILSFIAPALNFPRMNLDALSIGAYDSLVRELARTRDLAYQSGAQSGPEEHRLLMFAEGTTSTVTVRKDWNSISMAINGRTNGSDIGDMPTQVMLGQLPVLLAPSLRNSLVVGFATGVTAGAILQSPIELVECVELESATIKASHYFEHVNNHPLDDPRLHLIIDDARTYLRVIPARYDIIVSEPSHPWVPGVANLFTEEFFELGRDHLSDSGVFVQWLQIYQLSIDSLRSALATYVKVFPHVLVFRVGGAAKGKDLLLVGSKRPLDLDLISARLTDARISAELARVQMDSEANVRAWFVCDETQLRPATSGAIINTDDNMHIETTVPRETFSPSMQSNGEWIDSLLKK